MIVMDVWSSSYFVLKGEVDKLLLLFVAVMEVLMMASVLIIIIFKFKDGYIKVVVDYNEWWGCVWL
jgi:hypothetical protein